MAIRKTRKVRKTHAALKPGDRVRVRFDRQIIEGTVTSAHDDLIHVVFSVEGSDEPMAGLYRESELLSA
ncbi:hypothetical protein ACFWPH_14160 [Nocardia sp. NPDC058499]|uniref:hypothetical protein n=1 Tax=Nocardia sp. NPDC058499 TaxID=3346530 RepID=UPI00364CE12C